jgi:myo-inositol-1(or 4)-monophosphatase
MTDEALLELLRETAEAVRRALDKVEDWGPSGTKKGQYGFDLLADAAAIEVLEAAGVGILSEETGLHHGDRPVWVALDPVDGSTNASRGLPWYATSVCAVDADGPRVGLVVNQATGERFEAIRGGGAARNGHPIRPTECTALDQAIVGVTWYPQDRPLGAKQMRALGAAALDISCVAAGSLDAYVDFSWSAHNPWDYLAGALICSEAGAHVAEAFGRDLVTREVGERRVIVAAATKTLLDEAVALRSSQS